MKRLVTLLLLSLATSAVRATTITPASFNDLVDSAREIFIGETVARQSRWIDTPQGQAIVTLVTFRVVESLKGGIQTQTSLEFLGGTVGDVTLAIPDMPQFNVGDRDILFVGNRNAVSPLLHMGYGRFRVLRDDARSVETVRTYNGRAFDSTDALPQAQTTDRGVTGMSLAAFRTAIVGRLRLQSAGAR